MYGYVWHEGRNDWPGPFGKLTLQVACWESIEQQAQICRVGEIYHLRNVNGRKLIPTTFNSLQDAYELETKMEISKDI